MRPPSLRKRSSWQVGQLPVCPGCMKISLVLIAVRQRRKVPTPYAFQYVPFPGVRGEDSRSGLVSQRPSGFIGKGQVKLWLATGMKRLRFVEGQLSQAEPECLYPRGRGGPFSAGTQEDVSTLAPMAQLEVAHPFLSPLTALDAVGLLWPVLLRQEAATADRSLWL